ncbi:MAG: hypothetical protein GY820_15725 [Gammaproteobacteria bacterium]|nr:hypothetical protein [Gammaproteobacteria bacterium]
MTPTRRPGGGVNLNIFRLKGGGGAGPPKSPGGDPIGFRVSDYNGGGGGPHTKIYLIMLQNTPNFLTFHKLSSQLSTSTFVCYVNSITTDKIHLTKGVVGRL